MFLLILAALTAAVHAQIIETLAAALNSLRAENGIAAPVAAPARTPPASPARRGSPRNSLLNSMEKRRAAVGRATEARLAQARADEPAPGVLATVWADASSGDGGAELNKELDKELEDEARELAADDAWWPASPAREPSSGPSGPAAPTGKAYDKANGRGRISPAALAAEGRALALRNVPARASRGDIARLSLAALSASLAEV